MTITNELKEYRIVSKKTNQQQKPTADHGERTRHKNGPNYLSLCVFDNSLKRKRKQASLHRRRK